MKPFAVLVVDDNADAATMLAAYLRKRGHTVEVASGGNNALETVRMATAGLNRTEYSIFDSGKETSSGFLR